MGKIEKKLSDVVKVISGGTPKTNVEEYWNGKIPWLSISDFNGGHRWVSDAVKSITERGLKNSSSNLLEPGQVIISARGTVGLVAQIAKPMAFNQSCYGLTSDSELLLNDYLYYFLKCIRPQFQLVSHGAVFGTITRSTFDHISLNLPPLAVQRAITYILGTLDDKIELNRKMNETLEEMARAIFKSWFVDFDPVKARAKGRQPFGMDSKTAALFPDSFEDSELGRIPMGWKTSCLSNHIDIISGGTPKTRIEEYWNGEIPWYSVADAPLTSDVFVVSTEKSITQEGLSKSAATLVPKLTTIISARGTVGKCAVAGQPMTFNQSCYGVRPNSGNGEYFLYFVIRYSVGDFQLKSHGSVFSTITRETFDSIRFTFPEPRLVQRFHSVAECLMNKIHNNLLENQTLRRSRDILTPKLISGEIEVPMAEKIAREVI